MSPLPPEVAELLAAKDAQIAALTAQVQALLDRVAELERTNQKLDYWTSVAVSWRASLLSSRHYCVYGKRGR